MSEGNRLGRVAIVGAGQVGTMLGLALRSPAPGDDRPEGVGGVDEVVLADLSPGALEASMARGAGDRALPARELSGLLPRLDTVVLALPVPAIQAWLAELGPRLSPGTFVLDTGSAKAAVVATMRGRLPEGVHALGGHPMAGTERPGPEGADPARLWGATFALVPVRDDHTAMARGRLLATAVGARPVEMDAATHDRLVATASHLPHAMAFALALVAAETNRDGELGLVAGTGFAGAVRLARSDPAMVAGFLAANAAEVQAAVSELRAALARVSRAIGGGPAELAALLAGARAGLEELA
jgi:prephenate dehydrogenase